MKKNHEAFWKNIFLANSWICSKSDSGPQLSTLTGQRLTIWIYRYDSIIPRIFLNNSFWTCSLFSRRGSTQTRTPRLLFYFRPSRFLDISLFFSRSLSRQLFPFICLLMSPGAWLAPRFTCRVICKSDRTGLLLITGEDILYQEIFTLFNEFRWIITAFARHKKKVGTLFFAQSARKINIFSKLSQQDWFKLCAHGGK